jgi:putative Mg2+ transporter-C (MgtC) family protein
MSMDIIVEELTAGLPDAQQVVRICVRLLAAILLGALVGLNRERAGKPAGLRTHMLVALGSAMFVLPLANMGADTGALGRVIQGVATGIGFIGAGAIIKNNDEHEVLGLTTAAGIWLTATVGIAAGLGRIGAAAIGVLLAMVVLTIFAKVEAWTDERGTGDQQAPQTGHASQEEKEDKHV